MKNVSVSICDFRSQFCLENCAIDMSPISPTYMRSTMKVEGVPVDDITRGMKRKRVVYEDKVHRTVKKKAKDENIKDSSTEDDDDFVYEIKKSGAQPKIIPQPKVPGLSSYEKMIEKNKAERIAFLQSLKIDEVKSGLSEAVNGLPKAVNGFKKKKQPRRKVKEIVASVPLRKSRRLANLNVDLSENALFLKSIEETKEVSDLPIPAKLTFSEALKSEELYEKFAKDVNVQKPISEQGFVSYDKSILNNISINESNVLKVVPERITALAWYPAVENLILAAGDKRGNFSIWNVDSKSDPYPFHIHTRGVTNVQFNPFDPNMMISSSYDGTLRCSDMVKHMSNELYDISEETCCTYFDFLSSTTYLVTQSNGQVALIDRRTETKKTQKKHTCHEYSIKCVSVHPLNKNVFVTSENRKSVRLWDLRKLQEQPVVEILQHKKCINSAYFSPVSGNSILTTSLDDTLCVFDSTNLTQDIRLKRLMKHNNHTGRWLSVLRATWFPNSDETFVVGCVDQHPRRIQIFDKDFNLYHLLMDVNLTTITSTNAAHPFRPALAGANSSGKILVFT